MGLSSRQKGVKGEHEVRRLLEAAGWQVRGLEGRGDQLCIVGLDRLVHVEVKRQERLQLWQWIAQAESEAPAGAIPLVVFRRNHGEWRADLPLSALLELA